jgi:sporulation protein YqfC
VVALKKKMGLALEVAEAFDIPPEAAAGMPKLTITGCRRALIENHRGILEYSRENVVIKGGRVQVRIWGEGLELKAMNKTDLVIIGQIFSVSFD